VALNPKQQAFAREYLVDHNATQAAIRAGYSKKTAASQGYDLLRKPEIAQAVAAGERAAAEKAGLTLERLDAELARICYLDPRQAYDEKGQLLSVKDMPEDVARTVAGADEEQLSLECAGKGKKGDEEPEVLAGLRRKLKFLSKTDALALAYRRLGAFKDKDDEGEKRQPINIRINIPKEK
jgi:phage terminase small subunit